MHCSVPFCQFHAFNHSANHLTAANSNCVWELPASQEVLHHELQRFFPAYIDIINTVGGRMLSSPLFARTRIAKACTAFVCPLCCCVYVQCTAFSLHRKINQQLYGLKSLRKNSKVLGKFRFVVKTISQLDQTMFFQCPPAAPLIPNLKRWL